MKRRTLFTISSHHTDLEKLKDSLAEGALSNIETLIAFIKEKIGQLKDILPYCYRVTNMDYVKLHFTGTKSLDETEEETTEFYLLLVIAGYTELPSLKLTQSTRLNMFVTDATDAFWLTQLLRHELAKDG